MGGNSSLRGGLLPVVLALVVGACTEVDGPPPIGPAEPLPSPATAASGEPFLAVAPDGRALLSWLEAGPEATVRLRLATLEAGSWSEPRTVREGTDFFVNWADFPSVAALPDGRLAVHWLQREGEGRYAYGVRIAVSADGGATWSTAVSPHTDGTLTEHGFVSLFPDEGELGAIWLDGRAMGAGAGHSGGDMSIRTARILADGTLAAEALLDARTCECCQTDVAVAAAGPVVVYRDRSPDEVRDIAIVRRVNGSWTEPRPVHADTWTIAGCPVNGPSVVASGEAVAVAWFTAANDAPRVNLAFSTDGGATFGAPVRIDDGSPVGRVDLLRLDDGDVLVSWLERTSDGAAVRVRRVTLAGLASVATDVATSSAERASGFPRMVQVGDHVLFAWTQPGDPAMVRLARASLQAGPQD